MDQVEKLRRWLFPIGGGAYGVKTLKPINPNERSSLSVRCGCFTLNLFETPRNQIRRSRLNQVIDEIHRQFGFTKLVYATSLLKGGAPLSSGLH